jgi:hypothetical protein
MSDDDIQVTRTVSFCFTAKRVEVEGWTPFEVAVLLQPRSDPDGCFIFGGKIQVETANIFTGDQVIVLEYLRNVPPSDHAGWEESENAGADEASGGADPEGWHAPEAGRAATHLGKQSSTMLGGHHD